MFTKKSKVYKKIPRYDIMRHSSNNLKTRQLTTTTPTPSSTNLIGRQIYGGKFELAEGEERSSSLDYILNQLDS